MDKIRSAMSSAKSAITGQPPPQPESMTQSMLRQMDEATTLSWKQRAIGFAVCFGVGLLLSFLSLTFLWTLQLTKFAVMYTFGNICSVGSTMFLMGPCAQLKKMADGHRILATIVYVLSLIATLVVAFKVQNIGLVILCLVVQFAALIWYCVTWIPGGQNFLKGLVFRS